MAYSERELLARLIQCEAGGEGTEGMKAVASVVMNRVRAENGEFARVSNGGDVRAIILQPYQFTCTQTRNNTQNIYNMNPTNVHYEIADWALAGNTTASVGNSLFFFNSSVMYCAIQSTIARALTFDISQALEISLVISFNVFAIVFSPYFY